MGLNTSLPFSFKNVVYAYECIFLFIFVSIRKKDNMYKFDVDICTTRMLNNKNKVSEYLFPLNFKRSNYNSSVSNHNVSVTRGFESGHIRF